MTKIKKLELNDEKELEIILFQNPDYLEDGLKIVERQFPSESGPIDLLAIDSDNNLIIIELKIKEDDGMLLQSLRYYDYCLQNYDRIQNLYPEKISDLSNEIRIILVAPSFSQGLQKGVKYIEPPIDLIEYDFLEIENKKVLYCKPIEIEPAQPPPIRKTIDEHINYILDEDTKNVCKLTVETLKGIDKENIEVRSVKYYIGFQYKGRLFARIKTKHNFFYLMGVGGGDWEIEKTKIKTQKDITDKIMNKIKELYENLK